MGTMLSMENRLLNIDWDFLDSKTNGDINSIHPYPAKFIPEIPRALIDIVGLPKGTWILDPFCGSGPTLVEAQLAGYPSIGIDLNPIACLITSVKTRPLNGDLCKSADVVVDKAKITENISIPPIPNLNHWFSKDVQEIIARLIVQINFIENIAVRDALRLSLSSILVRVSNQESDTRYAAIDKKLKKDQIYDLFLEAAHRINTAKLKYKPKTYEVEVVRKDILQVKPMDIIHPVGLVITSPPYPNAYEYWLYHKYRMYWLGFDPLEVKEKEIGARAHFFKKKHHTELDFQIQMQSVMELLHSCVVSTGHICIVVGRSKIHGKIVDNANVIMEIARTLDMILVANLPRHIATSRRTFNLSHANIKTENILVFEKR